VPSALIRLLLHGKMEKFAYEKLKTVLYAGEMFPVKYLREITQRFQNAVDLLFFLKRYSLAKQ